MTLSGAATSNQSGPGSKGNEEVIHIPQSSRPRDSPSDGLVSYLGHLLERVLTRPHCRDVFYNPRQQGSIRRHTS